jgi:hypothetical protein
MIFHGFAPLYKGCFRAKRPLTIPIKKVGSTELNFRKSHLIHTPVSSIPSPLRNFADMDGEGENYLVNPYSRNPCVPLQERAKSNKTLFVYYNITILILKAKIKQYLTKSCTTDEQSGCEIWIVDIDVNGYAIAGRGSELA